MLILLAPSKTMDFDTSLPYNVEATKPLFVTKSAAIAKTLRGYSRKRLAALMSVSPDIATNVHAMYDQWTEQGGKPALWAYKGDVYKGMKAQIMPAEAAQWAQQHLLILSGLYGLVRPYDAIQRYRLEMKLALKVGRRANLYEFWADDLAKYVEVGTNDVVCNLSSDEYARVVLRKLPKTVRVVTPVFFDVKPNGVIGTVPIYSKMMRGVVARWMIDERVDDPTGLVRFTGHSYAYDAERSRPDAPAFFREKMVPLRFD